MMKVPDTKENMMKCICVTCPTYNQCMKDKMQGFFCAKMKTDCKLDKKNCICSGCPIWGEFKLAGGYFCESGAAA